MKTLHDIKLEVIDELTNGETQKYLGHASILNSAIDYLHSQGLLMVWQPIETAPKDDTKILLGCFSNGKWYEVLGRKKSYHYTLVPTGFRDFERATAWMPLPKGGE